MKADDDTHNQVCKHHNFFG